MSVSALRRKVRATPPHTHITPISGDPQAQSVRMSIVHMTGPAAAPPRNPPPHRRFAHKFRGAGQTYSGGTGKVTLLGY